MCGRVQVSSSSLEDVFCELTGSPFPGEDNFNLAPMEDAWVVRSHNDNCQSLMARWWLTPRWAKDARPKFASFNARCETLDKRNAFKESFRCRRCLLPISGFYEWAKLERAKVPYYIKQTNKSAMLLAGLWDGWKNSVTDEVIHSFTVVTTSAHPKLKFIHDRQPVILSWRGAREWLNHCVDPANLKHLFQPAVHESLSVVPVSSYVGKSINKDVRCFEPVGLSIEIAPD